MSSGDDTDAHTDNDTQPPDLSDPDQAREVLAELVGEYPEEAAVALMRYLDGRIDAVNDEIMSLHQRVSKLEQWKAKGRKK